MLLNVLNSFLKVWHFLVLWTLAVLTSVRLSYVGALEDLEAELNEIKN